MPRRARAQRIEWAAAGAANAGETKDVHRNSAVEPETLPGGFGGDAPRAALAGRLQCRGFVDPPAAAVPVDAGGREIAEPGEVWDRGDVVAMAVEDRVAHFVRGHGHQDMRDVGEDGGIERVVAIEAQRAVLPIGGDRKIRLASARAGNTPRRPELVRQRLRVVAEAEAQQMAAHGARFSAATPG